MNQNLSFQHSQIKIFHYNIIFIKIFYICAGKKSDSTKNRDHLEEAFIAAVMSEPTGKMDSVDYFVLRLAEGLRKLPYRDRAKLEIEFLSRIMKVQAKLGNVSTRIMLEIDSIKS